MSTLKWFTQVEFFKVGFKLSIFSFHNMIPRFTMKTLRELVNQVFLSFFTVLLHICPVIIAKPVVAKRQQKSNGKESESSIHLQFESLEKWNW